MSLHNSCAGNKPVITGGWGSGQAGRGGRADLPASSGFGVSPPLFPPPLRCFYSLCKRELLHSWKLGSTSKGRPACPACAPRPASQNPSTPNQEHPLLGRRGETEAQRPGRPRWETPTLCDIGPTELSATPLGWVTTLPQFTHLPPRGTPGSGRDTRLGHAVPRPSLAGEPDEPDPLPRAPAGLIGASAREEPPGAGAGARRD